MENSCLAYAHSTKTIDDVTGGKSSQGVLGNMPIVYFFLRVAY